MEYFKGKKGIKGKIAYVEQEPFIFADTFQNNITFGEEFDKKRYNEVIKVCSLREDVK